MASPGIAREGYEISFDHRMLDGVSEANHPFGDSGRIKKLATRLAAEMAPTASLGIKSWNHGCKGRAVPRRIICERRRKDAAWSQMI